MRFTNIKAKINKGKSRIDIWRNKKSCSWESRVGHLHIGTNYQLGLSTLSGIMKHNIRNFASFIKFARGIPIHSRRLLFMQSGRVSNCQVLCPQQSHFKHLDATVRSWRNNREAIHTFLKQSLACTLPIH